jgi:hypothetical protein
MRGKNRVVGAGPKRREGGDVVEQGGEHVGGQRPDAGEVLVGHNETSSNP